ncbi:MAG TPA: aldo/keto reductase [Phototrophicaceae bacterium]|nr:aldo/keto reductase [Phototrophicaceae bacterium]
MQYRSLGKTGLQVSKIALGCMSFGTPGWLNWGWVLDEAAAEPFFRRAVELGINFFDTADSYSDGRSEEITGRWLKKYAHRDEVVIATKVFFGPGDRPNRNGLSRKRIQQACENSLRRLGVETIDLYQIHRLDPRTPIEETLSALDHLVRQGKVRYIGAASMYAWEFMRALGLADQNGWARFISMQNHYNLLYREEERDMLPLCEAEGIGVIPWSPLARGLLARPPDESTSRAESDELIRWYQTPADQAVIEQVANVAQQRGVKPSQIALAWLLSKPAVAAPIVGVSKLHHLEEIAAGVDLQLTEAEIQQLEAPYRPKPCLGITPPFHSPQPGAVHDRVRNRVRC